MRLHFKQTPPGLQLYQSMGGPVGSLQHASDRGRGSPKKRGGAIYLLVESDQPLISVLN